MHAVPATLHDLLLARLDRMGSVRDVVQIASALGREFTYELLRAVCPLDETELRRELTKLIQAEILFAKGRPPQSSYLFKHALIQDAAYQSLLKTRRREFHWIIAQVLEKQFPGKAEREPELFARHCSEAGLTREALVWWEKAGAQALERSAVAEAIGHVTTGLRLVREQEESAERDLQEVRLQLLLSVGLMATEGYGSSRLPAIHARVRELCVKRGDREQLFQVLWGVWAWSFIRDELQLGNELVQEMAQLAVTLNEPGYGNGGPLCGRLQQLLPRRIYRNARARRSRSRASHAGAGASARTLHGPKLRRDHPLLSRTLAVVPGPCGSGPSVHARNSGTRRGLEASFHPRLLPLSRRVS